MTASEDRAPHIIKVIAGATAFIGTLDIADAIIFYGLRGASPVRVLQSIAAAAVLGRPAYTGGVATALLGLAIHFCIACAVATCYLLASRKLPLFRRPFLYGTVYGVAVYCVMNYIVIPLSKTPAKTLIAPPVVLINGVAALIFCIGIPLALIARRYIAYSGVLA
jgi:hypothetical protein